MAEEIWEAWLNRTGRMMAARCRAAAGGCSLWTGAITRSKPSASPYGIIKVRLPYRLCGRKAFRVHVMAYLLANPSLRSVILYRKNFDISHLCHESLCTNVAHLSAEPRRINNIRRSCRGSGACLGHGNYANCIL